MKKRAMKGIAVALCAGVLLISCSSEQQIRIEETYTIGVVTKSGTSEYWMSLCEGVEQAADQYGMDVIILQPDSEKNKEAQIKMVETLVRKNVDIIAISPVDSGDAQIYLEAAEEKDIPVITFDDRFDDQQIPYIGIDNEKAGYELMKYMAEQMDHHGQVGIISGPLSQRCHRLRIEGAKKYLAEETNMELIYVESGYSNLQMKETEIKRLQEEYPDVEGVMVTSAATAMGFVDAVSDEKLKIVSVDAQSDAVSALQEGKITALLAQSGYDVGFEMVRYIEELRKQGAEETEKILDVPMLTQSNVEEYMQADKKNGGE